MTRFCFVCTLGAAAIMLASGCSSEEREGFVAAGTVTHQGAPVPRGSILLSPDSSKGHRGPAISADIVAGAFDTSQAKQRLTEGAYRVRIDGFDGDAKPDQELPYGKQIFAEFTTSIKVTNENASSISIEVNR
ncbi:hypothetical protein [Blastopirellula marina]|nr:hypothetical protein [Blastopirellula marina]